MVFHNFIYFSNIFISDVVRFSIKTYSRNFFLCNNAAFPMWYALDVFALHVPKFLANMAIFPFLEGTTLCDLAYRTLVQIIAG